MHLDHASRNGLDMPSRTTLYILIPTFAVSGLLLTVGLGGAWYAHRTNRDVSDSLDEDLAAAQSAERLVLAIREVRLELSRFVETSDRSHLDAAHTWLDVLEVEVQSRQSLEKSQGNVGEMRFSELRQQLGHVRGNEGIDEQRAAARRLIATLSRDVLPLAERHLAERHTLASEMSRQNRLVAKRIGIGLLLLGVCGAVAGLLFGFGIARSVHRSLVEISIPVQDMAGRLNAVVGPIQVASNADLSQLDDALRMLSDKTADVVQRLQESQRKSLRREQLAAVGQLAAGLAHELRNPLMAVMLILQTASERDHESLSKRDLAVMQDEVTRLERMLQTFLDFARPPRPQKQAVDVIHLVETTLEVVRLRAAQQDVQLHSPDTSGALSIEADESQLRQLLLNLLLNALDALPAGGNVWLHVSSDKLSPSRLPTDDTANKLLEGTDGNGRSEHLRYASIRVADDGPGLAAEVVERVFEPFVSTKDTGIGLGLSICQQIVESHDGCITAGNRHNGGAEFTVYLPQLADREPATARIATRSVSEEDQDAPRFELK
jgi:signal transduction histidine kinase